MIQKIKNKLFRNNFDNMFNNKESLEAIVNKISGNDDTFNQVIKMLTEKRPVDVFNKFFDTIDTNKKFDDTVLRLAEKDPDTNRLATLQILSKKYFEHISFSQTGEDIIIDFLFKSREVKNPSYLDIGAFDPYHFSNTALLYLNGSRGINIEPNPDLFPKFEKERAEDINLNVGISDKKSKLEYYFINAATLNTFSKKTAEDYEKNHGHKIVGTKEIEVDTIKNILETHNKGVFPDFLTLDAEGVDMIVLKSIDFKNNYPKVICVETLSYSKGNDGEKSSEIIDFLKDNNYIVFADTHINTIFIHKDF